MQHDVIIVGGSYAGMSAALQLLRARRSVLIIDAGSRRNRFASHAHGFLGQDGVAPGEIVTRARDQLMAYSTLTWIEGEVVGVDGDRDAFEVSIQDGQRYEGRRILLASGVADQLPEVEGLAERWGQAVFHCPYCHGYELEEGPVGVIATGPMSIHQAELLTEWGPVTFLINGALELDGEARQVLQSRQVTIEETPIERLQGHADVRLTDGRFLSFAGLFTASRTVPASPLVEALGCRLEETPMGVQVHTDNSKQISIPGIFACGDLARSPHSIPLAAGDGAMAGAQVHRSLVWGD